MKHTKRSVAILFSIVFICLILFASSFIVAEYGHDCIGENCNICCVIDAAQKILGGLTLLLAASILFAVLLRFNFSYIFITFKKFIFTTLILLKVKLSD